MFITKVSMVAIAAVMLALTTSVRAESPYVHLYNDTEAQATFIADKIREHFPPEAAEAMIKVAECESDRLIHWLPDGSLRPNIPIKGKKATSARGVLQILFGLHAPDIKRLGLDMYDIDDYMRYGRHLYDTQGPKNAWEECVVQMPATVVAMLK